MAASTRPSRSSIGDRVFVGAGDKQLLQLSTAARARGLVLQVGAAVIGRPVADDQHVYFVALDNLLRALDRNSGRQRWQTDPAPIAAVVGTVSLVGASDERCRDSDGAAQLRSSTTRQRIARRRASLTVSDGGWRQLRRCFIDAALTGSPRAGWPAMTGRLARTSLDRHRSPGRRSAPPPPDARSRRSRPCRARPIPCRAWCAASFFAATAAASRRDAFLDPLRRRRGERQPQSALAAAVDEERVAGDVDDAVLDRARDHRVGVDRPAAASPRGRTRRADPARSRSPPNSARSAATITSRLCW